MGKCFIIQPFDGGKFDKRFIDVFMPAIHRAGLIPYRVDMDPAVRVPIEEIEKGIAESVICFAEITTDNPNVWYELGFAFAHGKDVVMVCSDERQGSFPFDIQHRYVIKYETKSTSDFTSLGELITKRTSSLRNTTKTAEKLNLTPVVETEGLKSHEIALLILVMESSVLQDDFVSVQSIKNEMNKSGYTDIATSVSIRTLEKSGMIETHKLLEAWNSDNEYRACKLTQKGEQWILNNQDLLEFRKAEPTPIDELPF